MTCTATDTSGNTATCSFTVTANDVSFSFEDPLDCIGPGSQVAANASMTNHGVSSVAATAQFALPGGLQALPGTCIPTLGTCSVLNANTVSFSGTIPPGQTVSLTFLVDVGDQVPVGTNLCSNAVFSFGGGPTRTLQSCFVVDCPAVGPGLPFSILTEPSDQKPGSVLIYNAYTSSPASPATQNTRFNITNTEPSRGIAVHLFFVDGSNCSVADRYICLTPNQTMTFLASEQDPGTSGYLVAIAVNTLGCPVSFNYLIGDEFVKYATGHEANLGAEAVPELSGGQSFCNANTVVAQLNFDGISYGRLSRVLASSTILSRADGNNTLLIVNRIGGSLAVGGATIGAVFGIVYDDAEAPHSFTFSGDCQFRAILSNALPRLTPRFETVIPSGQTGWLKLWAVNDNAILGAQIVANPGVTTSAGAFSQGHNLHKLKLTTAAVFSVPVFTPGC